MGHVDTLVSELSPDLVDSVDATDDQHLVVQLRRDSHEQLHVQVVVVSHERLEKLIKISLIRNIARLQLSKCV